MGDGGFQFLDILLLGAIAGFIALRLRAVLGQRSGHEQQRRRPPMGAEGSESPADTGEAQDNVIPLPRREDAGSDFGADPAASPAKSYPELAKILAADPHFDPVDFMQGASAAYEMIVTAFAAGDKATLKPMLSREVFADFEQVIDDRARKGEVQETTFVGLKNASFADSQVNGRIGEVTVKFDSELISVTRDRNGVVIAGDASRVDSVTDIWTFARDLRSRDPNWTLIATATPN
ncbi:Tim44/TimA family putative adaptor protein [Ferrovibrio sp.]|uniref:Tim44/TimA family putative adaptor protein n=1 Tax=Ferrovibrio sp. TaxID=1917215 RepID=UPI0025C46475|nr:Tim44/TimA family putative adaptor protein [Ferrovibrio sp.]MBX3453475.1 Tim44 domain-containing protein [Ferrovibrio sp.]